MSIRKILVLVLLAGMVLASGACTTRSTNTSQVTESTIPAQAAPVTFANQVAAMPTGSTQYFEESPFGAISIQAGSFYTSGLGKECRSVVVSSGAMGNKFALCREKTGPWEFVPSVYEGMSR